jgi:hypothetical protein
MKDCISKYENIRKNKNDITAYEYIKNRLWLLYFSFKKDDFILNTPSIEVSLEIFEKWCIRKPFNEITPDEIYNYFKPKDNTFEKIEKREITGIDKPLSIVSNEIEKVSKEIRNINSKYEPNKGSIVVYINGKPKLTISKHYIPYVKKSIWNYENPLYPVYDPKKLNDYRIK